MRKTMLATFLFLVVPIHAQNPLRQAMAEGVRSMAWKIQTEGVSMCCCDGDRWSSRDSGDYIEHRDIVLVAHLEAQRVTRLRMMDPNSSSSILNPQSAKRLYSLNIGGVGGTSCTCAGWRRRLWR